METKKPRWKDDKNAYFREYSKNPEQQEKKKEYRQSHKDDNKIYYSRYRTKYPDRQLYRTAKTRAEKRQIEFNIEYEDIVLPEFCPVLGIKLKVNSGSGAGGKDDSYSLDRIDNTKGYIKGNVQVISHKANSMKSTATADELIKFAEWIMRTYK